MRTILQYELDHLKQLILSTAGIKANTPAVFKDLSALIYQATKKQVSNSTLKRIFGFASYTFQPSLYTLNVLAEYCGYESWMNFTAQLNVNNQSNVATALEQSASTDFAAVAYELSQHTLQHLKHKSGIPFHLTIPREVVNEHLDIFGYTGYTATVIASPAGYGKTVALCHWVEQHVKLYRTQQTEDVCLFINSKALTNFTQTNNLNYWLSCLSGLTTDSFININRLQEHLQQHKFYLIIDALDHTSLNYQELEMALNLILDIATLHRESANFKMILAMRSATWVALQRQLILENKTDQFFLGFMTDNNKEQNLPPFTLNEIKLLADKLKPGISFSHDLQSEVLSLFNYPPFFQYYYQQNQKNFSLNNLDIFDTYEVLYNYILDKIYYGRSHTEKVIIIHSILNKGTYTDGRFCTDKLRIYEDIQKHNNAYEDLLSQGIIREINFSNETGYIECVEFVHNRILSYCIAAKLFYDNHNTFNETLINGISCHPNHKIRLLALKWCIFLALKNKQISLFNYLPQIQLVATDKASLIIFLVKLVEHGFLTNESADQELPFDITKPELFNFFFGMEFIATDYKRALNILLKLKIRDSSKIWIYTCLGITDLISLNAEGLENTLAEMKKFPPEAFLGFQINPLYCLETFFYYFKFNIIKTDALADITKFSFSPNSKKYKFNHINSNHILYMLALGTLRIGNHQLKVLRFINTLHRIHNSSELFLPEFHMFLLIFKAYALLNLGRHEEALSIFGILKVDYLDDNQKFTPFMKAFLDLLATRLMPFTSDHSFAETAVENISTRAVQEPYQLLQVNILSYYLSYKATHSSERNYQTIYFKFIKLMRSSSFDAKCFVFNYDAIYRDGNENDMNALFKSI